MKVWHFSLSLLVKIYNRPEEIKRVLSKLSLEENKIVEVVI
jgi:hypothetical protein